MLVNRCLLTIHLLDWDDGSDLSFRTVNLAEQLRNIAGQIGILSIRIICGFTLILSPCTYVYIHIHNTHAHTHTYIYIYNIYIIYIYICLMMIIHDYPVYPLTQSCCFQDPSRCQKRSRRILWRSFGARSGKDRITSCKMEKLNPIY